MRRILTFLISAFVGLWASTASAETTQEMLDRWHDTTDGTLVRLHAKRSPSRYLTNTSGETLAMPVPEDENDATQLWILRPSGEGFTLQNTATTKYLSIVENESAPKAKADAVTLYIRVNTVSGAGTGNWVNISCNSDFSGKSTLNMNADNNTNLYIWTLDEGGIWTIEEAEEVDPVAPEEGKTYYLHSMLYDRYVGESSSHQLVTTTGIGKNIFPVFTFEKSGDGFLIKNVVTERYITGVSQTSRQYTSVESSGQVFIPERVPHSAWFFKQNGKTYGLHVAEDNSYNLVSWTNTPASVLYLEPAEVSEEEIAEMRQIYDDNQIMASLKASNFTGLFANNQATELTDEYKNLSDEEFLATEKVSVLPESIKEWLLKVKNNTWAPWEKRFRIQDYEAASNNDYWAEQLKITAFSPMYNPTGITLQNGETAIIWVKQAPYTTNIYVEGHTSYQDHTGQKRQKLKTGFNLFVATADNMQLYIDYKTRDGNLVANHGDMSIQIVGGKVNGYFDTRNWSDTEWMAMKKAGLFTDPILDVVGNMVQWRVKTVDVLDRLTQPVEVMKNWDRLIGLELNLMGLTACPDSLKDRGGEEVYEDLYPKKFNNRMLCFYNGNGGNPYSTYACTYYTSPDCFTDDGINPANFDLWTGGHEIGHNLQPAINLAACTEVSNNLFSGMVAHEFGKVGRSVSMSSLQEHLANGNTLWLDHLGDVFHANHMYYGLYLYYHAANRNPLFWPKMFKLLRKDPLVNHGGQHVTADQDYLKFALKACEAAGEDLTEYFDLWGFFVPFDGEKNAEDYTKTYISVNQTMINNVKAEMAKYPKANGAIMFIDDFAEYNAGTRGTMDSYRSGLKKDYIFGDYLTFISKKPSQPHNFIATYNKSTGVFSLPTSTNADGVAGIKVYDRTGKLIYLGNTRKMTIPTALLSKVSSFKISLPDGTDMPLYTKDDVNTSKRAVQMTIYSPEHYTGIIRYTNGEDEAMRSDLRDGENALAVVEDANLDEAAPTMRTAKNVIVVNDTDTPQAANLELTDNDGLHIPFEFMAAKASYSRTGTGGKFNTVVLPFDMPKAAFGEGAILEDVDRIEEVNGEVKVYFKEITDDVIVAGRPIVVYTPASVDAWTPDLTQQSNVMVVPDLQNSEADVRLVGSYKQSTIGAGKFKLNADGTAQEKSDATTLIEPFRAYLQFATAPAATSITLVHVDGTETGITDVDSDILSNQTPVYDLQGRRVFKTQAGGIYIQNGKKVVVLQ